MQGVLGRRQTRLKRRDGFRYPGFMRKLAGAGFAFIALLVLGHWSGSQPERDSVSAASAELDLQFESRMIDVGEVTLHVVFAGPKGGPPALLLHGFPEFWYAWRGPAAVLARAGFRVIVPDQRGYNLSDKPSGAGPYRVEKLVADIVGLIDALGYPQVAIGAQDMGARVAWQLVLREPARVSRFAVIDVGHPQGYAEFETEEETVSWYRTFLQIPWLPGYSARLFNWRLLATNLRATSAEGAFPDVELDQFRSAWDRDGAIHSMGAWYRAPESVREADPHIETPTLLILAANDAFIPSDASRAGLKYLAHGTLLELGSGTHWVAGEEPERIGQILVDFLSGRAPSERAH
jgi:pimeloyl-ACP methyl ester carboxylesterase